MSKVRLSHSAASLYQTCGKKYEYHYLNKLRSKTSSSALFFGSAVDAGTGAMLKNEGKDPNQVFTYLWTFADLNGTKTYLPTCTDIVYSDSDADSDLLEKSDREKLASVYGSDWEAKVDAIVSRKKDVGFKFLTKDD